MTFGGAPVDKTEESEEEYDKEVLKAGLQNSVEFVISTKFMLVKENNGAASFAHYVDCFIEHNNKIKLRLSLEQLLSAGGGGLGLSHLIFNYGLNINNWHLFVNKQILMRYERLFIEKQLNEIKAESVRYD